MAPKPAAESTPMTAVDTAWLRMESASSCMMISGMLIFDRPLPILQFRRLLEERFLRFRRFRQLAVKDGGRYYWQDDPQFDLDNHLHAIALPGAAGKAELQALMSDLNSTHLDLNKPLWQMHHIDNYGEGSALLVRIHHCIADGLSLVRVLLSLSDDNAAPEAKVTPLRPPLPTPPDLPEWQKTLSSVLQSISIAGTQIRHSLDEVRRDPTRLLRLGRDAWKVGEECLGLGLQPADPPTRLKGSLCGRNHVAWADPLDFAEVKEVARAFGGTTNDVLMTAAAGALHAFLARGSEAIPAQGIHVAVPFNLRPLRQPINILGNQFGLVLLNLPVAATCPRERFTQVQRTMDGLKRSHQAQVTYSLLNIFGRGPDLIERRALEVLSKKASAVMTNVPGPRKPVYFCGVRLAQPMFWVPQTGDIGVGLSIFSYQDSVQFGLISDKRLIEDPEEVVREFVRSFETLKAMARGRESSAAGELEQAQAQR